MKIDFQRFFCWGIFILVLLFMTPIRTVVSGKNVKKIAVLQFVEHPALARTWQGIKDGVEKSDYAKSVKIEWNYNNAQGNIALASQIAQKCVGSSPDVVVTLATAATLPFIGLAPKYNLPVIFASVTDPVGAGLVKDLKHPNLNITGVSNFMDVKPQIEFIKKVLPSLKTLGGVYNLGEPNSVKLIELIQIACKELKVATQFAYVNRSADVGEATAKLIGKVDAIFVSNDSTVLSALGSLIRLADNHQLPVFLSDTDAVEMGAVGALGPNQYELGLQVAKMIVRVLEGETLNNVPVEFPVKADVYLNLTVAKKLNLSIPKSLVQGAKKCY